MAPDPALPLEKSPRSCDRGLVVIIFELKSGSGPGSNRWLK
jgi:hypothetical protein